MLLCCGIQESLESNFKLNDRGISAIAANLADAEVDDESTLFYDE